MPIYDLDKIEEEMLPVFERIKTIPSEDGKTIIGHEYYIVSSGGEILSPPLPHDYVGYIADAINKYHFDIDVRKSNGMAWTVLGSAILHGSMLVKERKISIYEDKHNNPRLGLNIGYRDMLQSYKGDVLVAFASRARQLPYRKNVSLQVVYHCGLSVKTPRITDMLSTIIDLLIISGIIITDRQVVNADGSRVDRQRGQKTSVELLVRAFND